MTHEQAVLAAVARGRVRRQWTTRNSAPDLATWIIDGEKAHGLQAVELDKMYKRSLLVIDIDDRVILSARGQAQLTLASGRLASGSSPETTA